MTPYKISAWAMPPCVELHPPQEGQKLSNHADKSDISIPARARPFEATRVHRDESSLRHSRRPRLSDSPAAIRNRIKELRSLVIIYDQAGLDRLGVIAHRQLHLRINQHQAHKVYVNRIRRGTIELENMRRNNLSECRYCGN